MGDEPALAVLSRVCLNFRMFYYEREDTVLLKSISVHQTIYAILKVWPLTIIGVASGMSSRYCIEVAEIVTMDH